MRKEADFAPVTNALWDESPRVRDAAQRVMSILRPLLSQSGAGTDFEDADSQARDENFGAEERDDPQPYSPDLNKLAEYWRRPTSTR